MSSYYPIFLNIKDKLCIVVGGGEVAERKVKTLIEQGAKVRVISPNLTGELQALGRQGTVLVIGRDYSTGDLKGAFIAIAATAEAEINHRIAEEGKKLGIPVNVVDDPEASDFIVPSLFCRGDVTIAISTGGRSPALARKIRTELESHIGTEYDILLQIISQIRTEFKKSGKSFTGDAWQETLDLEKLLPLLRAGHSDEAKRIILSNLTNTNGD